MEERRQEYPRILDILDNIKTEMSKMAANMEVVATKVEERNSTAIAWRLEVCNKFDKIFKWLGGLPCKERAVNTKLLWLAIGVIGGLLFAHLGWKR
jgi:hypothetical protein